MKQERVVRPAEANVAPAVAAGRPPEAFGPEQPRPLIDAAAIFSSVWRLRKIIIATTILGGIGGVVLAMATPNQYVAESKLYVDPREMRLTDSDLSKGSLATEAILALVDSQLEVLRSRAVLEKVATELDLYKDANFGGKPDGANAQAINPKVLENLSDAVSVRRDPKTFVVNIEVTTRDAAKSARIANSIVATFLEVEQSAQSGFFQRTTAALGDRLTELRSELDTAEKAVEKYKADNDIVDVSGQRISDKQLLDLNDQVTAARSRIADAQAKVNVTNGVRLDDVLSGAFPEEVSSVTLQELRKQFSEARARLGSIETSLGPRHPQRIAAAQAVEVARTEIGNELRRIVATQKTELQRATRTEQDLLQQLNVQKSQQVTSSGASIELRELERKATATRTLYESFLKRASETGEEEKLTGGNIRVISAAEPPLQSIGPSRKLIAIGGLILGFAAGVGLGVMLGLYGSIRSALRKPEVQAPEPVLTAPPPPAAGPPPSRKPAEKSAAHSVFPAFAPSAHHRAASVAALSAFRQQPAASRRDDGEMDQVRSDLRALRNRVETYARSRPAARR